MPQLTTGEQHHATHRTAINGGRCLIDSPPHGQHSYSLLRFPDICRSRPRNILAGVQRGSYDTLSRTQRVMVARCRSLRRDLSTLRLHFPAEPTGVMFEHMNKRYRLGGLLLAFALFGLTTAAFAGGGGEPSGGGLSSRENSLKEAIDLANFISDDWDYNPRDRLIHAVEELVEYPFQLNEAIWAQRLDPFEYYVLREQGTEYAFSDLMHANKQSGIYYSRATGQPLFRSEDKYDSGTGWPSFTRPISPYAIIYVEDVVSYTGIEIVDSLSGSHLGHVFCINATALIFVPDGEDPPPLIAELQALVAGE